MEIGIFPYFRLVDFCHKTAFDNILIPALPDQVSDAAASRWEQTEGLVEQSRFSNLYDIFDAGQG